MGWIGIRVYSDADLHRRLIIYFCFASQLQLTRLVIIKLNVCTVYKITAGRVKVEHAIQFEVPFVFDIGLSAEHCSA